MSAGVRCAGVPHAAQAANAVYANVKAEWRVLRESAAKAIEKLIFEAAEQRIGWDWVTRF